MNTFKIKMSLNSFFSILFGQLTMGNTCLYTIFFFCVCFWCVCVCGSVYVGVCGSLSRCGCKIVMNLRDIVKTDHFTSFLGLVCVCMYVCVCLCVCVILCGRVILQVQCLNIFILIFRLANMFTNKCKIFNINSNNCTPVS